MYMDKVAFIGLINVYILLTVSTVTDCRGSNYFKYRAKRYGSYYSSSYYSYTGGRGWARYSRVYAGTQSYYTHYYNYMFEWFKTDDYKIYKSSPSSSISVCKNYEADDNGTYLGIFTCPLPFVPADQAYCCGIANAEYCCSFWDVPLNVCAAVIASFMGVGIVITSIWVICQMSIRYYQSRQLKRQRNANRNIGIIRRMRQSLTLWSVWQPDNNQDDTSQDSDTHGTKNCNTEYRDTAEKDSENQIIHTSAYKQKKTKRKKRRDGDDFHNTVPIVD